MTNATAGTEDGAAADSSLEGTSNDGTNSRLTAVFFAAVSDLGNMLAL